MPAGEKDRIEFTVMLKNISTHQSLNLAGVRFINGVEFDFTTSGAIDTATSTLPYAVSTAVTTGAVSPMAFTLDLDGSTQFGSAFGINDLSQDGFTSGRLSGFSVGADGVVTVALPTFNKDLAVKVRPAR